jgi:hypothetical protein
MLRLKGAVAIPDGLVQVSLRAILQDEINVGVRLEGVEEVDDVGVRTDASVESELLRLVVDGKLQTGFGRGRPLGQTLDRNRLVGLEVLGREDHAKGTMVERRDCLIAAIKKNTTNKLLPQALHFSGAEVENVM